LIDWDFTALSAPIVYIVLLISMKLIGAG